MNPKPKRAQPCSQCHTPVRPNSGVRIVTQIYDPSKGVFDGQIRLKFSEIYCSDLCAQIDAVKRISEHFEPKG